MRTKYLVVLVGGVVIAAGPAAPAPAQAPAPAPALTTGTTPSVITAVERVEQPSASNSNAAKSVTVQCPGTKKVINASGYVTGGSTKVLLDQATPSADLTEVTVSAKETDPYTANWTVSAVATCADPPSGLTRTEQIGLVNDSASPKTTTVGCADSTQIALGTGFDIVGGAGEVGVYSVEPIVDAAGRAFNVDVSATEIDAASFNWRVDAYDICADATFPEQVVYADGGTTSDAGAGVTVYCPYSSAAVGTGYAVDDAIGEIIVNSIDPGTGSTTTGSSVFAYGEDGTYSVRHPRAYAICANR
jgi:hypothetical protein